MSKQMRWKHNLSNKFAGTCKLGELIPVNLTEVLPGDTVKAGSTSLIRLMPMLAPQLTKLNAHIVHYYIPSRLLWDDWENFITGGESGNEAPTLPTINLGTVAKGSLADYFGIPTGVANTTVNAMPFRAYAMIWNEYFADKDINTDLVVSTAAGADTTTSVVLKHVNWAKDMFTSAKPWEQRGTQVTLPLGTTAPVVNDGNKIRFAEDAAGTTNPTYIERAAAGTNTPLNAVAAGTAGADFYYKDGLRVDLSTATAASIQSIRQAFALQKFMERQALYGGKYSEYLAQLGIVSLDARLQKPEFLSHGVAPIQMSEVLSTDDNGTSNYAGKLRGHGIGGVKSNSFMRFIPEHGYIMSLMYIRPEAHYLDGLNKMWFRSVRTDFYDINLAAIGMDEVRNKEVYLAHSSPTGVHGYNWRYYDYMEKPNIIAGDFRDSVANHWHLARDFSSDTALNEAFIKCDPGARIFAEQTYDHVVLLVRNHMIARRPVMPITELMKSKLNSSINVV